MKLDAETKALLAAIAAQIRRHARNDGEMTPVAQGLMLFRTSATAIVQRGILRPSFCVVAQGEKLVHAGSDTPLRYGAGDFLASSIEMPVVGQVVTASKSKPYLAGSPSGGIARTQELLDFCAREVSGFCRSSIF